MTRRSAGLWLRELPALLCTPGDGTVALGAVPAPPFPSPRPQREQASVCTVACTVCGKVPCASAADCALPRICICLPASLTDLLLDVKQKLIV